MVMIPLLVLVLSGCSQKQSQPEAQVAPEVGVSTTNQPESASSIVAEQEAAAPRNPLMNVYFGELHVHTAYSLDSYIFGNTLNDPFEAYKFAKGETVTLPNGATKRIKKPLDFAAITDHAEALGEFEICTNPAMKGYSSTTCQGVRSNNIKPFQEIFAGIAQAVPKRLEGICGADGSACVKAVSGPWSRVQQAAAENYEPGKFTSFVGFEYSGNAPEGKGGMMHRNVIFKSASVPGTVFSAFEGTGEALHAWLEQNCTGDCNVLTIPHNSNFYWGRLYWGKNSDGSEWTQEQVERRARMDRLVEIMQIKGASECQVGIMTSDEECNFELIFPKCPEGENAACSNEYAFVRNGLKLGLRHEAEIGVNPFKHGIVGGTDNHNGTPSDTAEDDFQGHLAHNDGTPQIRLGLEPNPTSLAMGISAADDPTKLYNPGAVTGVWAESNTRADIWDALHRKETFGTSGTRTAIRMFAGFDLPANLHEQSDWVSVGYDRGVPQGGDLTSAAEGQAPTLVVWARRDPQSAPLQKLQIIKGWRTADDELQEMTYDVACSDGGVPDKDTHRCPDNGATVNLEDCSISTDRGSAELATTWTDPDFNAGERAFYYARVLENPVCRWSMYDAHRLGVKYPDKLKATVKERAWSSPVWYTP